MYYLRTKWYDSSTPNRNTALLCTDRPRTKVKQVDTTDFQALLLLQTNQKYFVHTYNRTDRSCTYLSPFTFEDVDASRKIYMFPILYYLRCRMGPAYSPRCSACSLVWTLHYADLAQVLTTAGEELKDLL